MDSEFWGRLLSIVLIDLMLAGDNALVIALAVRTLPPRARLWGRVFGTAGAVVLRLVFITLTTLLLRVPFVQLVGGVLLVGIALKLVRPQASSVHNVREGTSLGQAIWIIIAADAVMSLDNVLGVAGAARGDLRLVVFGIALSLPLVVWGSGLLATLMNRWPWIIWVGGGVLGWVAGEMIAGDAAVARAVAGTGVLVAVPYVLAAVLLGLGWWWARVAVPARAPAAPVSSPAGGPRRVEGVDL
ncbi:MAG TPA: TerC family protein [Methylomirabilota bacterium]